MNFQFICCCLFCFCFRDTNDEDTFKGKRHICQLDFCQTYP